MRPGIFELTITSLASTVPTSCRSPPRFVVSRYQISDPMVRGPESERLDFAHSLGFTSNLEIWHSPASAYPPVPCAASSAPRTAVLKDGLAQKLHQGARRSRSTSGSKGSTCDARRQYRRTQKIESVRAQERRAQSASTRPRSARSPQCPRAPWPNIVCIGAKTCLPGPEVRLPRPCAGASSPAASGSGTRAASKCGRNGPAPRAAAVLPGWRAQETPPSSVAHSRRHHFERRGV